MATCTRCGSDLPDGATPCPKCSPSIDNSLLETEAAPRLPGEFVPLDPGTVLAERYRILALAGRGGEGEVYQADDLKLGQTVAVKILPESFRRDERRLARLISEVRIARRVSHPNVCRVYDIVESEGQTFLTMEWIDGESLASLLQRKGRLSKDTAIGIARQISLGLAAAHDEGVLHRDLKPGNVMIDDRGVVRITDFGLATTAASVRGATAREGTPLYMSPEQLAGAEVTAQSDMYALGLVLFEVFTGRHTFPGRTLEQMLELRSSPPPDPKSLAPDLHPAVSRVILRCLDVDQSRRPPSGREVAAALPGGARLAEAMAFAQRKADRISAFREELTELRRAGLVRLDDNELAAVERHHDSELRDLISRFDVDVTERGKQLALGMRVVSLLGAVALAASAFFFFNQIWGVISIPLQIGILTIAPLAALVATDAIAKRERGGYFTSIAALFAFACLVLDQILLGATFNQMHPVWELLAWGASAMILADGYRLPLLRVVGLVLLAAFVNALLAERAGAYWPTSLDHPEGLIPAGFLLLALRLFVARRMRPGFAAIDRVLGLIFLLFPMILLAIKGSMSYLHFDPAHISVSYQILGFAVSAGAIALGVARRFRDFVYCGALFFVIFLYVKFVQWWWDWMPKYLFFLIVALAAMGVLWALKRLRAAVTVGPLEAES
jgi:tRNA A-37 threonylcarbamoyl transferase component Bud32